MLDELRERVRAAAAARTPLEIRAGGTKSFYGQPPRGEVLDPRGHAGIVAYEPTELVVTARCGTPLADLEAQLDAQGQMLAFEPPHYAHRSSAPATVGGCVAAGLSGPRRATAGSVRDFMLGAKLMTSTGDVLAFGGTVMKNVAGYDVARMLAGSLGTLGLILEVSLKVLPRPSTEVSLRFELDETSALARMNQWAGLPLPISATVWTGGLLFVRLSGARAAVRAAQARLGGEAIDDEGANALWRGIREHRHSFFVGEAPLWRLAVPSIAEPIGFADPQLIEWGGALRWFREEPADSAEAGDAVAASANVRKRAAEVGGHATLFRGGDKSVGVFTPLAAPLAEIHRRLKAEFDPTGIFNPGRMYPDL
jgi:glycolate oxidase FAD binding subunit